MVCGPCHASSACPDLPPCSCLRFWVAIPPRLERRLSERPRPIASIPAVVTTCQLGAWWSLSTLDPITRKQIGQSAWLVTRFSVHARACPAASTPAPRPRAPLTTFCCEELWKVLLSLRSGPSISLHAGSALCALGRRASPRS